jgi:hypothetical protein
MSNVNIKPQHYLQRLVKTLYRDEKNTNKKCTLKILSAVQVILQKNTNFINTC